MSGEWIRELISKAVESVAVNVSACLAFSSALVLPHHFSALPKVPNEWQWLVGIGAVYFGVFAAIALGSRCVVPAQRLRKAMGHWWANRKPLLEPEEMMILLLADEDGYLRIDDGKVMGNERIMYLKCLRKLERRGLVHINAMNHASLTVAGDECAALLIHQKKLKLRK
jgi:hypothetical protein